MKKEEKQETIEEAIERGNVPCPDCSQPLAVAKSGWVAIPCANCGYGEDYEWNLFVRKN